MHVNKSFSASIEESVRFINRTRFGTLVSHSIDSFDATPIPWIASNNGEAVTLVGHLANANPQVDRIREFSSVIVIFTGVNGYISPRFLPTPRSAPTWNYIAVHVHGSCTILDAEETEKAVEGLVAEMEGTRSAPWSTKEMGSRRDRLLEHVTGLRIDVEKIESKFKLGQNESHADLMGILKNMDDDQQGLVKAMHVANAYRLNQEE